MENFKEDSESIEDSIFKEDNYFDEESDNNLEEEDNNDIENVENENIDDIDPLDAFMNELNKNNSSLNVQSDNKGIRDDIEQFDNTENYDANAISSKSRTDIKSEGSIDYDHQGNPFILNRKTIEPLKKIEHELQEYEPFNKKFYQVHPDLQSLKTFDILKLRKDINVHVNGKPMIAPVSSFAYFGFDSEIISIIRKNNFTKPTDIQSQAIPIILSGYDVIGIAKTGSGKTLAFVLPLLVHLMDQRCLDKDEGPISLILAPTRELSLQIHNECKKFGKPYNISVVCAFGGGNMHFQGRALSKGAEIVVGTPGRVIDLVKKKNLCLKRVTYLVFDEADRMFSMGFEKQVRSISNNVRPDRQTLLFSATFKKKVEKITRDIMKNPHRISHGEMGDYNKDIFQMVYTFKGCNDKMIWLLKSIVSFLQEGNVLVFVSTKIDSQTVATTLKRNMLPTAYLHGDLHQHERFEALNNFKSGKIKILVATDVASRGLDIPNVKTVVNYDIARTSEAHTHRIGRTGRAGTKGTAYTLVTPQDKEYVYFLLKNLDASGQIYPPELITMAQQSQTYKRMQSNPNFQNTSKARPGLGSNSTNIPSLSLINKSVMPHVKTLGKKVSNSRQTKIKTALKKNYEGSFVAASNSELENQQNIPVYKPPINPEESSAKKSRWN